MNDMGNGIGNKGFSGTRSRRAFVSPSRRCGNCRTIGKRDGARQLAFRRKVCRNIFIKGSESLKFKARPHKMLRPGLLPASRRIGSASADGSNPSRGSLEIVSFPAVEYNRANCEF